MHYYQFNIKDYSFATIRMTLIEDLAFRRMLDLFYESELPLPLDKKKVSKLIGMVDHQEEVESVLGDFWNETEHGFVNERALCEINKYQAKAESARVNGKKGGRPIKAKITQSVNLANPEKSESKANHKPLTINQEPLTNNKEITSLKNDGFDHWWKSYPKKVAKPAGLKAFKSKTKNMGEDSFMKFVDLISSDSANRYLQTEKQFIPNPATYLNEERYNDE